MFLQIFFGGESEILKYRHFGILQIVTCLHIHEILYTKNYGVFFGGGYHVSKDHLEH